MTGRESGTTLSFLTLESLSASRTRSQMLLFVEMRSLEVLLRHSHQSLTLPLHQAPQAPRSDVAQAQSDVNASQKRRPLW